MINNLKTDTVEARRVVLETFLEDILSKPKVRNCSEFVIFLSPSDRYELPAGIKKKKVTKLKQPEHLKKLEEEKRQTMKSIKKEKTNDNTSCTLEDILGKMGGESSIQELLPSQHVVRPNSIYVEQELKANSAKTKLSSSSTNQHQFLNLPSDINLPTQSSPVRIRRRGRGRGQGIATRALPKPASPRKIHLRAPTIIGEPPIILPKDNFSHSSNTLRKPTCKSPRERLDTLQNFGTVSQFRLPPIVPADKPGTPTLRPQKKLMRSSTLCSSLPGKLETNDKK